MSNKTIFERQEELDYEWKDGDDTEIYEAGYEDGFRKGFEMGIKYAEELKGGA